MTFFASPYALVLLVLAVTLISFLWAPRRVDADGFFGGADRLGRAPGLWTLTFSQVTTWIFARSLMNAAILGFYYGMPGALAYTAYYLSFITGMWIVGRLRMRGAGSVQEWLREEFGPVGTGCYNVVVALRLMSEVFANLLVVGVLFGAAFEATHAGELAMVGMALIGLGYSAMGGLRASLRTDVVQMALFAVVFAVAFVAMVTGPGFFASAVIVSGGVAGPGPGWALLAVALLQVLSYPAHDPVMMDRGFLADERTTRNAFLYAFWISAAFILGFGIFGIQAGILAGEGEAMEAVWARMFGPFVLFCLSASLIVSALSTLDSALASAARLAVVELRLGARTVANGRIAMAAFMLGGVLLLLAETEDLFAAVAVSGTASMFLAPVLLIGLFLGRPIPLWSYLVSFAAAMAGAAVYFFEGSAAVAWLFGDMHKYLLLLEICIIVLAVGFGACLTAVFADGRRSRKGFS
ncbi:sodium:proline symporter [Algicella marina]|uniref:Sodium:proline symporter n=1 Tax=Algicella marina TaxID=2683284 RepID=A0A6P1SYE0_9RHOB|nr:sodium:proline symporter [Algicella marina]QHQ34640.1 sodium:proline symporter [Algicella marina]